MNQIGDIIELDIERMSFGPAAVARYHIEGTPRPVVVFVKGAAPQDRVRAKITKIHKNFWDAETVNIIAPSPSRVEPPCPVFGKCGGCQWQHLSYEAQVQSKKDVLIHQLERATRMPREELIAKTTAHPAAQPFGYRARVQVRGNAKGLGFYEEGSRDLAVVDECLVCHPSLQEAWQGFAAARPLGDLSRGAPKRDDLAKGQFKVEWTLTETGQVLESINREHAALGFTQINPEQNKVMIDLVTRLAQKNVSNGGAQLLLDLYAGSGNLSRQLTSLYRNVLCIEAFGPGVPATEIAGSLAPGQTLIRGRVEGFLEARRWREWGLDRVDCVIADPPRAGLEGTAKAIAALNAPSVVLVSCDPSTLSRDLAAFLPRYRIEEIHMLDMFPQTYHIETVVGLVLN